MKVLIFIFLCITCFSCNTERQAARKTAWLIANDKLAEACAKAFPAKPDSIVTRIDTVVSTSYDTVPFIIRDTVPCKDSIIYREHKCPPNKTVTNTIYKDTIIYKPNTFEVARLNAIINGKDKTIAAKDATIAELQNEAGKDNWWKIAAIVTWCLIVIYIIIKIKSR